MWHGNKRALRAIRSLGLSWWTLKLPPVEGMLQKWPLGRKMKNWVWGRSSWRSLSDLQVERSNSEGKWSYRYKHGSLWKASGISRHVSELKHQGNECKEEWKRASVLCDTLTREENQQSRRERALHVGKLLYNAIEAKMKEWSTVSGLWGVKYNERWELTTILCTTEVMGYLHKSGFCSMVRDEVKLE